MNLKLSNSSYTGKILIYLIVKLFPVCNNQEGVIAFKPAQYLLREKSWKNSFRPLRMPENSEPALILINPLE